LFVLTLFVQSVRRDSSPPNQSDSFNATPPIVTAVSAAVKNDSIGKRTFLSVFVLSSNSICSLSNSLWNRNCFQSNHYDFNRSQTIVWLYNVIVVQIKGQEKTKEAQEEAKCFKFKGKQSL